MTTNLTQIVDAISKKQFNAAQDMLSDAIQEKLSDSLIARKDEVALDFGQEVTVTVPSFVYSAALTYDLYTIC